MKRRGKRVSRRTGGFSLPEALMATAILALCAGLICDAMAFGAKHLRERTKRAHAIILLDTLRAAVRNDLEYATAYYDDNSFACPVRGRLTGRVWYDAESGQLVRKIKLSGGEYFFDPVAAPESYSGYGEIGGELRVNVEIEPIFLEGGVNGIDRFSVAIALYDAPGGAEALARTDFTVIPVTPIPYSPPPDAE